MKKKANVICMMIAILVYSVNQCVLKKQFDGAIGYFCKCYLNDLVCPLFFLSYSQILLIWAEHEIKSYIGIVFLGMIAGCIWEFFAPIINPRAVTDIHDLICYFCGCQIYYLVIATIERKLY